MKKKEPRLRKFIPYPFAAASVIDSFDGGYMQYLLEGALPESDWEK